MTFFEVDPLVVRIATDPRLFTYATRCAAGTVDYVVGDARQTLRAPAGGFDVLVIDAFSSDAVPAHLLTAEAIRDDLADLGPGGLLVLHLSNRHLDLMAPAEAGVIKAGAAGLARRGALQTGAGAWDTASDVVVASRRPEALAVLAGDPRWRPLSIRAAAWTDDYTDLPGAVWRAIRGPAAGP